MRVVMLDAPQELLEERRRRGVDKADELWDGVLHLTPPPSDAHQSLAADLFLVVVPLARRRGLVARFETGLFRTDSDYRVPDQLYTRPELLSPRGAEGAVDLVVEILSPGDETYDKVEWYAAVGVGELLILDPADRRAELLRQVGGRLLPVSRDASGALRSDVLAAAFTTSAGRLTVAWHDGSADL